MERITERVQSGEPRLLTWYTCSHGEQLVLRLDVTQRAVFLHTLAAFFPFAAHLRRESLIRTGKLPREKDLLFAGHESQVEERRRSNLVVETIE